MSLSTLLLNFFIKKDHHLVTLDEEKTFVLDTFRSGVDGISQTLVNSVFLLVGIQYFQVNDFWKSIISSSTFFGMVLSLFTSVLFHNSRPPRVASLATMVAGILLVMTGFANTPPAYGILILLYGLFLFIRMPLFTAIYAENYDPGRRAKLFAGGVLFSLITGILSKFIFGFFLDRSLEAFRLIFIISGFIIILSGFQISRIPFNSTFSPPRKSPLKNLSLLFTNPLFGLISLAWFILGFANLWNLPLRTVYLAEAERGLGLSPMITILIVGVIPTITKLVFNNIWAKSFDYFDFLPVRIVSIIIVSMGTLLFYMTRSIPVIIVSQIIMNIGFSASPFLWNLWVTKIVEPGESRAYMSVHTFLCGIRGILGPFIGFIFIQRFSMKAVGYVSFSLLMISLAILIPMMNHPLIKKRRLSL
jgi:MFS family permease